MQRFHAAVHDLGESGVARYFTHGHAVAGEQLRRAARRKYFDVAFSQRARKLHETGFIRYGEQRAANRQQHQRKWVARARYAPPDRPSSFSFLRSVPRLIPRMPAARLWLPSA